MIGLGTRVMPSLHEDWSDYKVHFNTELDIDIPEDMRRYQTLITIISEKLIFLNSRIDQYCATLAHKANHSFTPNTRWGRMDHPKYAIT